MPANAIKSFADKVVRQVKSDPKKAAVLAVLLAIMGTIWIRMAGGSSATPAHASANESRFRTGPGGVTDNLRVPGRISPIWIELLEWHRKPIAPLSRNLFVVNYDFFPQDGSRPAALRAPSGDGFWDQLAKSMTWRADQKREREVLVENLRSQAAQLKVQSTMMSAPPKALINGVLVAEGDVVASFRVSKIEARRIVVEREGIKLEIRSE